VQVYFRLLLQRLFLSRFRHCKAGKLAGKTLGRAPCF